MDMIYEIRRRYKVQKQRISEIAREMGLSRPTVRKYVETVAEPKYERAQPAPPKLGAYQAQLQQWLEQEVKLPRGRRRTARRLFEGLQERGYAGAYDSVQRMETQRSRPARHRSLCAFGICTGRCLPV